MGLNWTDSTQVLLWLWESTLHRRHNDHDGVSSHQPHGCLLNRLFRRRSKETSKLLVTGLCAGNSPGPVNSPHKRPVTRKMFPFDDVIMITYGRSCNHTGMNVSAFDCIQHFKKLAASSAHSGDKYFVNTFHIKCIDKVAIQNRWSGSTCETCFMQSDRTQYAHHSVPVHSKTYQNE